MVLEQCQYCKDYFCKDHIRAVQPGIVNLASDKPEALRLKSEEGHPCPAYIQSKIEEEKRINEDFGKALDRMSRRPLRRTEVRSSVIRGNRDNKLLIAVVVVVLIILVILKLTNRI